jgi:hypothetical protein
MVAPSILSFRTASRVRARSRGWWFLYLLISNLSDFEQNFVNAWSQRTTTPSPNHHPEQDHQPLRSSGHHSEQDHQPPTLPSHHPAQNQLRTSVAEQNGVNGTTSKPRRMLSIFLEKQHLEIPVLYNGMTDSALLEQLRMFYRYSKVRRGLVELIIPRRLVKINCVKVS